MKPTPLVRPKTLVIAIGLALSQASFAASVSNNPMHKTWHCHPTGKEWTCTFTTSRSLKVYTTAHRTQTERENLAQLLGWIPDDSLNNNCSVCGGHYYEPNLKASGPNIPLDQARSHISYTNMEYKLNGDLSLTDAQINQPNRKLYADSAVITPQTGTTRLKSISAKGNIRYEQPGMLLLGDQGQADLADHKANLNQVAYLVKVKPDWNKNAPDEAENFTGYAHGQAAKITQQSANQYVLYHTTYSTCPPTGNTWQISASKIHLDRADEMGTAHNMVLRIHGVPVFYLPYFTFPISPKRKSGFLFPTVGNSSSNGASLSLPFYFNISPQFDDTLTPTYYSRRGLLLSNQFRYLTHWGRGILKTDYMFHDRVTGEHRENLSWTNQSQFSKHWSGNVDYNYVSDSNYLKDFDGSANAYKANQILLNRQASISYASEHIHFSSMAQYYQIVNPDLNALNRPYNRLPELDISLNYPDIWQFTNFTLTGQFVNFQKSPLGNQTLVTGQRLNATPSISLPWYTAYSYVIPKIAFSATSYLLENRSKSQIQTNFDNSNPSRLLPIFSVNAGMYFDRALNILGRHWSQTLEPRIHYLYVPYKNQSALPVFDTTLTNFNYFSLFNNNIFSGLDRISNANQLSLALQTDIHNSLGVKKLEAGIGQIVYFANRKVSLCNGAGNSDCLNNQLPDHNKKVSDVAAFAGYYFSPYWNVTADLTYNTFNHHLDMQSYNLQYRQNNRHIVNLGFQFIRHDYALLSNQYLLDGSRSAPKMQQLTASSIWKIAPRWTLLGQWNFSVNNHRTVNIFGGFEYDACCWAARFIIQRYVSNSNPNDPSIITGPLDTSYVIQFELKGLGSTNEGQIEDFEKQIPGFETQQTMNAGL